MDIGYFIKKMLGGLAAPLPISLLIIAVGWYICQRNNSQFGKRLLTSGLFILLFCATPITSQWLIKPFEFQFTKLPIEDASALRALNFSHVVVLGCWHSDDEKLPLVAKLRPCSLTRVVQAAQIWHQLPQTQFIFSGYAGRDGLPSDPQVNAALANSIGVPLKNITLIEGPKDTEEEVTRIKEIVQDGQFVVISSASHLLRIQYLLNQYEVKAILSPAEFLSGHGEFSWRSLIPNSYALAQSERAFYEALGNIWVRLKALF